MPKVILTAKQKEWIAERLDTWSYAAICRELGISRTPLLRILTEMGLKRKSHPVCCKFKKGHESWNKGLKGYSCAPERTLFKKGRLPHNTREVGYERIDTKDGYIYTKVAEGRKMVLKHKYVYEQAYGKIPKGHCLWFKDRDKTNCSLDNLELITRGENMRRNSTGKKRSKTWELSKKVHRPSHSAYVMSGGDKELRQELTKYPDLLKIKSLSIVLKYKIKEYTNDKQTA